MRGLLVAFFVLLVWSSPVLPQVTAGAGHGNYVAAGGDSDGHAIDSDKPAPEDGGEEASGGGQCVEGDGPVETLSFYACRARAMAFGSVERAIVTFTALLALSTLLAVGLYAAGGQCRQDRGRAFACGGTGLCVRRTDRPVSAARSGERQARHAELRQDAGGDPRVVGRVRGAGAARGQARLRQVETDTRPTRSSNRSSCSPRRPCFARKLPRRSSSSAISAMKTCSGSRTPRGSVSAWRATARRLMPVMPNGTCSTEPLDPRL